MAKLDRNRQVGLIAGAGRFPFVFAEKARAAGIPVVCVGIRGMADPGLREFVDVFYWSRLAALGRMIRCFRREGVRRWTMAGKIYKVVMYSPWRWIQLLPDWRTARLWLSRRRGDNRDDTLLNVVIRQFENEGMHCESALSLCPELLVQAGVLTQRSPSERETQDIAFGWGMAREMGRLDIGQSVMVHERCVLAVEAIEGTDQAIRRAGELCRGRGFVVVKVAKPHQDMRFDVPTVGQATIETMQQAGARVLAVEAERTILLDAEATIALADRYGISIVVRAETHAPRLQEENSNNNLSDYSL